MTGTHIWTIGALIPLLSTLTNHSHSRALVQFNILAAFFVLSVPAVHMQPEPDDVRGATPTARAPSRAVLPPPLPRLHRDSAHPTTIPTGTAPSPATPARGFQTPVPHLQRDPSHLAAPPPPARLPSRVGKLLDAHALQTVFSQSWQRHAACDRPGTQCSRDRGP
jgi:hypothetical protein